MYKCKDCGKQFIGGKRRNKSQVITDYIEGKQTLRQLALRYDVSERTIRRDLTGMHFFTVFQNIRTLPCNLTPLIWGGILV